ncbi:HAD family hydrolase [Flavobacterium lindanitolerans]|uniref:HAD superfamily hydrolase (TIGR01509 family)/HAD superfamily hydrolase (TIGR01549 family) n=1 Tax=Flavobacterium lindanitolerans TaxID=428988 RepID=A0A497UHS0_9FLAO|nr:HAD family hydrolase [Flavobacterium lindanitolerans]MBC8644481.1 HAD family hydrolase [Flavobacterium lindanitolerans]PKW20931.1 HAD superfamily hydrolase (TIGR01509 family)/HAD superfamily hydrolase (TIGR01549 family) [Flavobacterium lindanitolerans]RLJ30430.1 HAD superfamily hydrolase (TIGR01509 family)/HAD superfamily hydrolase (TIGR01549 family) [Flavobacterium lindanitolerans]
MIKTVIFDMDGVIVDTEPVHRYAYFQHFDELEISVTDDLFATFTGNSTRNVFQKLKHAFGLDHDVEDLIQRKRNIFNDAFDTKKDLHLIEGVEDLIKDLYKNGIQLIVASSASKVTIERVFNRFKLHQYFSDIVSGEDFPKSKPHPAIFEYAASLAIGKKDECIVIEDSTNGVEASVAAGIFCIGYRSANTKLQDLSKADRIINHFNELNAEKIKNLK